MNGVTFALLVVLTALTSEHAKVFVLNVSPPMSPLSPATNAASAWTADQADQCHRRLYTYRIVQSDAAGRQCWDLVNVWACFGRCVSQQIGDWKFPHRLSYHPVCVHEGRGKVVAYLRQCDDGVAASVRRYEYVEAVACKCQVISSFWSRDGVYFHVLLRIRRAHRRTPDARRRNMDRPLLMRFVSSTWSIRNWTDWMMMMTCRRKCEFVA